MRLLGPPHALVPTLNGASTNSASQDLILRIPSMFPTSRLPGEDVGPPSAKHSTVFEAHAPGHGGDPLQYDAARRIDRCFSRGVADGHVPTEISEVFDELLPGCQHLQVALCHR